MSEPRWVRVIALGSALALASFGGFGLLLADLGIYKPLLVLVLGLAGFVGLYRWARPILDVEGEPGRAQRICARVAVALSAVVALWNCTNAAQHAQINRDGGLYLNAGKWIATHGTLNVQPFKGPFANNTALIATSTGMKQRGTHLEFDLSHMLSAVLAEAQNLGGNRLMWMTVPLISGFALLAFYLLASRLLPHPVAALGATATLALLMPQISFARDSTTEIPIQVLLFTSLWLLCDRRTLRTPGPAFVSGLLLGLIQAMHADGLAFLIGLPAVFAITWLHTRRKSRKPLTRGFLWAGAGVSVGLVLSAIDLWLWDRYYLSIVGKNIVRLGIVQVLAIAAVIGAVVLLRKTRVLQAVERFRPRLAYISGAVVAIVGFGAWFVRPHIQHVHAGPNEMIQYVQRLNNLAVDPTKRYSELSMRWISWYIGPIALTLAIIAAAGLTIALVRGSVQLPVQIATFVLAPPALLYIWRPTITPDQIWAARRFLPAVLPALILLTFAALCAIADDGEEQFSPRRSAAIVVGIAVLVAPWLSVRNISQMTEQRGLFSVITKACKTIGPDGAVVMPFEKASVAYLSDPQTLRGFCNVPVMVMPDPSKTKQLHLLAAQWKAEGRTLYVVSEFPETVKLLVPNGKLHKTGRRVNRHLLEQTLTRRPSRYIAEPFQLSIAEVPIAAGSG